MLYEPPPNPDDWISDGFPSRHVSESVDDRGEEQARHEEVMTWAGIMAARRFAYGGHDDLDAEARY